MKKTFTRQEVIELMKGAWWEGHYTSPYTPNLAGSCAKDVREGLADHEEELKENT